MPIMTKVTPDEQHFHKGADPMANKYSNYSPPFITGENNLTAESNRQHEEARKLAIMFSKIVSSHLGEVCLAEVVALNNAETDSSICHSHDFIDPNQSMIDAMDELGIELNLQDEKQVALINSAWDIAKRNNFKASTI